MASFDVIIIGAGPGGYVAAIRCAQLGLKTAVVEKDAIGGRCLNYACIPAKAVLRSADLLQEVREAAEYGITTGEPTVDFGKVMERRGEVVATLTGGVGMLLKKHKVDVFEGHGTLTAAGKSNPELISELYLAALSRHPSQTELAAATKHVDNNPDRMKALEDVCWALLNANEFLFQH